MYIFICMYVYVRACTYVYILMELRVQTARLFAHRSHTEFTFLQCPLTKKNDSGGLILVRELGQGLIGDTRARAFFFGCVHGGTEGGARTYFGPPRQYVLAGHNTQSVKAREKARASEEKRASECKRDKTKLRLRE